MLRDRDPNLHLLLDRLEAQLAVHERDDVQLADYRDLVDRLGRIAERVRQQSAPRSIAELLRRDPDLAEGVASVRDVLQQLDPGATVTPQLADPELGTEMALVVALAVDEAGESIERQVERERTVFRTLVHELPDLFARVQILVEWRQPAA